MTPPPSASKPVLFLTALPYAGHVTPVRTVAAALVQSGHAVYMLSGTAFRDSITATGAHFIPLPSSIDVRDPQHEADQLGFQWKEDVLEQVAQYFEKLVIGTHMDPQIDAIHSAIRDIRAAHPHRPLIALTDVWFFGSVAIMAQAPGPRPDAWIGLGLVPVGLSSRDCAPWGPGELPDPSPQGRARDESIFMRARSAFAKTQERYEEILTRRGAQRVAWFWDEPYLLPDRFVQLSLRSLEWPRTDAPVNIRFSGGLPKTQKAAAEYDKPAWWSELANHRNSGKRVVAVSQGTIDVDPHQLVLPTMEALADRDDILLVVALGKKDRALPPGTPIPANARVEGWIPYDELLPNVDVFVTNGGYGSLSQAVMHALPLVVAGGSIDKPEVAARAEWAGLAVNLRTATPGPALIKESVEEVLEDSMYAQAAKQLQQEFENADPLGVILETIEELIPRS